MVPLIQDNPELLARQERWSGNDKIKGYNLAMVRRRRLTQSGAGDRESRG